MIDDCQSVAPLCPPCKSRAKILTPEEEDQIRAAFHYEPDTGVFTWKECGNSRKMKPGDVAGCIRDNGFGIKYWTLVLNRRHLKAHRVAFFLMTGQWPHEVIDHKNGDGTDNRFENLRLATYSENSRNKKAQRGSVSGLKGVVYLSGPGIKNRFRSTIYLNGRSCRLGHYPDAISAHEAYCSAAFFAFGEFANVGY